MDKSSLGDRMKKYESVSSTKLMSRTPVIIRIDGKAFHTMVKRWGCKKPFDCRMHNTMRDTSLALCHEIQNAIFAYTQSDEISILLKDWAATGTQQWFGGKVQKMTSVSASLATARFTMYALNYNVIEDPLTSHNAPLFDARVYNIPEQEVMNYFIWRQQDASRNSVQMFGRSFFSHKELHKKNNSQIQDMLMDTYGQNWDNLATWKKRGLCIIPHEEGGFCADSEPPIFTQEREYVEGLL